MRRLILYALLLLAPPDAIAAQEAAVNPLAELNDELTATLAEAGLPFSEDQAKAIALMMEERRRASEELFGDLMDFRSGPTQGQEADRLKSAIEWMRAEFLGSLTGYLTDAQADAWARHRQARASATSTGRLQARPSTSGSTTTASPRRTRAMAAPAPKSSSAAVSAPGTATVSSCSKTMR